jgi:hypothetical protein
VYTFVLRLASSARMGERAEVLSWGDFRRARPDLADAGRGLLYQFGVGLAFLATVRKDGGPRVHPVCPLIVEDRLLAFLVPSPKAYDLHRDRRYALHAFPPATDEDAFYVTGEACVAGDRSLRRSAAVVFFEERGWSEPPPGFDDQELFEFRVASCLLTRTTGHGDHEPRHITWRAADGQSRRRAPVM